MRQLLTIFIESYCFIGCLFPWCYFVIIGELENRKAKIRFAIIGAMCYAGMFLPRLLFPHTFEWIVWQTDPFWMATTRGKW
jgi:hypothetical protein